MRLRRLLSFALCLLAGCAPTAAEIKHLGQLSQAARTACDKPGACPTAVACIRSVIDATRPGNATRATYKAALTACDSFPVLP